MTLSWVSETLSIIAPNFLSAAFLNRLRSLQKLPKVDDPFLTICFLLALRDYPVLIHFWIFSRLVEGNVYIYHA